MKKKIISTCGMIMMILCISSSAHAALMIFTDRASWQAAAGGGTGDLFENFNTFTTDIIYGVSNPVTAGFLTLEVINGSSDNSWRIDALPAQFSSIPDVDGTTFATTLALDLGGTYGGTQLSFDSVTALGFDYAGSSYSGSDCNLITSHGESTTIAKSDLGATSFIGLLYTEGEVFSSLAWSSNRFAAGIDNVEGFSSNTTPTPEPSTILLFSTGLAGLISIRIRRK